MKAFLPGHKMICPRLWVLQFTLRQSVIHLLVYTPPLPPYTFDCVILQVTVSLRASLKQLIISVVVTIHQNSPILNWPQIASNDLLKCCYNLATLFRAQAVKEVRSSFLNHLLLWWQHGEILLLFGKFKACIKTCVDFKL